MKVKKYQALAHVAFVIFFITQLCIAQSDNGNHFELTWSADFNTFSGNQGKGLVAFAGTDIDQNGMKEFFVFDKVQGFVAWDAIMCFEAVGDNDFQKRWEQRYSQDSDDEGHGIAVADLDDDGFQELYVCAEDKIFIYEWDGTTFESGGGLPQEPTLIFDPILDGEGKARIRQLRIANLDDDPELELFMGYWGEQDMYCAIASLPGKDFSNPDWKDEYMDPFPPWRLGGMEIGDFDGDGKMEIFTCNFQDAPVTRLYESNGADMYDIKFTTTSENLTLNPAFDDAFANPVFHDFDGDGNSELVITDIHGKVFVITKEASNNFEDFGPDAWTFLFSVPDVQSHGFVRSGFVGDLDQDGKADIYYNDFTASAVLDLEYQSGPVTDPNSWIGYKIYAGHRLVYGHIHPGGDLDGDGRGEIVIAGNGDPNANLQIIENIDATKVEQVKLEAPITFKLNQNYPNPFNPVTEITYELAEAGYTKLEVFSILGQHIVTLVDSYQSMGTHKIRFDAESLSAGIYFYHLTSGEFMDQNKMILIK